jgi:hypothetical protein
MKSKLQMRHWCEHCKKSGAQRAAMLKHEMGCTLNWQRKCRMCEAGGEAQVPADELQAAFDEGGFKGLRDACSQCPACTLTVLRKAHSKQAGEWAEGDICSTDDDGQYKYDFKADCKDFWSAVNSTKHDDGYY